MVSQRYELFVPTLAIVKVDGYYTVVYVPFGNIVTVKEPLNGASLVDVNWNGKAARMFASDLRERAELVQEAAG